MGAMAALGDRSQPSGEVARRLGYAESGQTSVTRDNLIEKDVIY
jgi:hypothetical protein